MTSISGIIHQKNKFVEVYFRYYSSEEHYFFTCPNYTEIRRIMMNNLNWVQTSDLNLNLLTNDHSEHTYNTYRDIL
jgi:ssDNA-specific exonuclease RecJ